MNNKPDVSKVIDGIKKTIGNRKYCYNLPEHMSDYAGSIVGWLKATTPVKIDALVEHIEELQRKVEALAAEGAALKVDVPLGAIENGRAFAERLEAYPFECQGGNLNMCSDWLELRRCFEHLSEWAMHSQSETPATDAALAGIHDRFINDAVSAIADSGAQTVGDAIVAVASMRKEAGL